MEQISVKATLREATGKQKMKQLRTQGEIPAVVYHRGEEPLSIQVNGRDVSKIIHDAAGENLLINLQIENAKKKGPRPALIKEVQYHPVKRSILHIDFNEISLTEAIVVDVEVMGQGDPIGVKQDGGVLDHPVRMVKIQCLPMDIPKHIDVDISGLKLGGAIHVRDLAVSDKIKILTDGDTTLFHVKLVVEKVEDPTATAPEVEVIREKKEEEGAAGTAKKEEAAKPKDAKADKK